MLTINNVDKLLKNTFKDKLGMEWFVDAVVSDDPEEYLIVIQQRYGIQIKNEVVLLSRETDKGIGGMYLIGISKGFAYNQREYKNKVWIIKDLIEDRGLFLKRLEYLINDILC
jgi:hypothetical protein